MLFIQAENKRLLMVVVVPLLFFIIGEINAQNYPLPSVAQEPRHAVNESVNASRNSVADNPPSQLAPPPQPKQRSAVTYSTRSVLQKDATDTSAQNSVRIRSIEAGRIIRPHGQPSCMNCGVISYVYPSGHPRSGGGYGNTMTGMSGGVVAIPFGEDGEGRFITNIGGILGNASSYSGQIGQGHVGGKVMYYDIGVMLENGTQTVVRQQTMPNFNVGERVKLIDGVLLPNP